MCIRDRARLDPKLAALDVKVYTALQGALRSKVTLAYARRIRREGAFSQGRTAWRILDDCYRRTARILAAAASERFQAATISDISQAAAYIDQLEDDLAVLRDYGEPMGDTLVVERLEKVMEKIPQFSATLAQFAARPEGSYDARELCKAILRIHGK